MRRLAWGALFCAVSCTEPVLQLPTHEPVATQVEAPPPSGPRARAFVIERAADLVRGPAAEGKLGDLRLDNGRVVFIIDGPRSWTGFAESGGNLIDAIPVGGQDGLKQVFGYLDDTFPRQPRYDSVEPGQLGEIALVRAFGRDSLNPALRIETVYALRPGANALEITTTVTNTSADRLKDFEVGDAVQWGRTERFAPGHGFVIQRGPDDHGGLISLKDGWVAGLGEDVTYAYVLEGAGALTGRHGSAWSDLNAGTLELAPGASGKVTRWLVVGDRAGSEVTESVARLRKQPEARLEGRVVEESTGQALAGARVILTDSTGRPMSFAGSTATGYSLLAPPGDYHVHAEGLGRRGLELQVTLSPGKTTVDVMMSRPGRLAFRVTEGGDGGTPTPAKLTLLGVGQPDPRLGPSFAAPGGNVAFTVDGQGEVALPPGHYRAVASRGPEFTIDERLVDVADGAGEPTRVSFELKRAVDWKGWLCADLHQHAAPSPDSAVSLRDRAAANLAEGLETLVATDHNVLADWTPTLAALKATRPLALVLGNEATLDGLGHWNAYPLVLHADQPHGGAFDVRDKSAHEIIAGLRAADGAADRVVQVNHPRAGLIGYFNTVKLDPHEETLPKDWEGGFDAIEVFSSKDVGAAEAPLRDWFALLDRGLGYTAVGGSDSHLLYEQEVGYPRTCVPSGPSPVEALVSGIKHRHEALITNGPFVRVSIAGKGMGQLAPAPHGRARLDVEVQAAPWVDVRRLEVFINGVRHGKPIDIPASRAQVRYKDSVELRVNEDAYVVVLVRGDLPLEPVVSHRAGLPATTALAITNPIYLDRDSDGKYTAPRLPPGQRRPPARAH